MRKVLSEGILQELKQREFYVKPAEKRKEAKRVEAPHAQKSKDDPINMLLQKPKIS